MGVIDLDHRIIGQIVEGGAFFKGFCQDQPGGIADHKILLADAQHLSGPVAVIRVQEQGQVLLNIGLVKGNALGYQGFIHGFHIKEMKGVGPVSITGNLDVIHSGGKGKTLVRNLVGHISFGKP